MLNLKRTVQIKERDHSLNCTHHCALCKNPCEKQGRYLSPPAKKSNFEQGESQIEQERGGGLFPTVLLC